MRNRYRDIKRKVKTVEIMLRTFIQEKSTDWNELVQIDTESEKVKIYSVDKEIGFPFSEYYTMVAEMGYKSVNDIIKRMKSIKKEIATDRQIASEITGLLKLAKYRSEHGKHTYIILKDNTKYNDIVERLKSYGMEEAEAVKKIDYFLNYNIEQHNVKVIYSNDGTLTTAINGTIEEIENYYRIGSIFNIGVVEDDLQEVISLQFIF